MTFCFLNDEYLLTYVAITTRLSGFVLPIRFCPGASALRMPPPVGHTKRSQGLFNLVLPTRTQSSSNTRLGGASSSIRTTWPSQRNLSLLIHLATSMPLKSSYSSRLVLIANSYWTKTLAQHFSLEHSHGICIGA